MNKQLSPSCYREFCAVLEQSQLSVHSVRAYRCHVRNFLRYALSVGFREDEILLEANAAEIVSQYQSYLLLELQLRKASVNAMLSAVRMFYKTTVSCELVANTDREVESEVTVHFLSFSQQQDLENLRPPQISARDRAIVLIMLRTGIRPGECAALNISDLAVRGSRSLLFLGSGRHLRRVELDPVLTTAINQWLGVRKSYDYQTALFITRDGGKIYPGLIDYIVKHAGWSIGVVLSARLLRNTFARNALQLGIDSSVIAGMMGASPKLLCRIRSSLVSSSNHLSGIKQT